MKPCHKRLRLSCRFFWVLLVISQLFGIFRFTGPTDKGLPDRVFYNNHDFFFLRTIERESTRTVLGPKQRRG